LTDEHVARLLFGESRPLSESARRDLLSPRFSYFEDDLAVLTWNGALIVEPSTDDTDVEYVLEFANAQLLELRFYDSVLDRQIPRIYDEVAAARRGFHLIGRRYSRLLAALQGRVADATELVERVENSLKVTDDVYLARIYAAALEIFSRPHLACGHRSQGVDRARRLHHAQRRVGRASQRGAGAHHYRADRRRADRRLAESLMSTPNRQLEARAEARTRIISPEVRRRALLLAIAADVLQLGLLPLFGAGWLAPLNDVLDVIIAILMVHRLGWHMAFLPTLVAELLPVVDIFPSWTLAVLFGHPPPGSESARCGNEPSVARSFEALTSSLQGSHLYTDPPETPLLGNPRGSPAYPRRTRAVLVRTVRP
jgi:hypothetical protein